MLTDVGLSENEAATYLALLGLGTTTVGPVVKESRQPWSTCYSALESLVEKGFASYKVVSNKRYFTAASPDRFREMLEERVGVFGKILPELLAMEKKGEKREEVSVFIGYGGMRAVYERLLKIEKPGQEHVCFGIGGGTLSPKVLSFFGDWDRRRADKKVVCKMVISEDAREYIDQAKVLRYTEIRTVPKDYAAHVTIDAYADMSIISLWTEQPYFISIESDKFANAFRAFFNAFWKMGKPVRNYSKRDR